MVAGKMSRGSSWKYHQSIAALLMFSKIERSRHSSESNAFPMLVVCPTDVVVLIYQPETDTLPLQREAYFLVWEVLHHNIFPIKMPLSKECGYKNATTNLSLGDYWYLDNRSVLQANPVPELTTVYDPVVIAKKCNQ